MQKKISIIIPMKNESGMLNHLFSTLNDILSQTPLESEIIIVNDGSTDNTLEELLAIQQHDKRIKIIDFSRNFGKENAVYAGFAHATGDCAVTLDADLQDPPELLLQMIEKWQEGYEVVTAVRSSRETDSIVKRSTASLFYKIISKISDVKLTPNAGDYRLLDRAVVDAFLTLTERTRFNKGLFTWLGFREYKLYHKRVERVSGTSKWNYFKLFNFAFDGITSFSTAPLKIWTYLGVAVSLLAFLYGSFIIIKTLVLGIDLPGYASLAAMLLFFSGIQLIGIGVLGEYVGRLFIESKKRPLYVIRKVYE